MSQRVIDIFTSKGVGVVRALYRNDAGQNGVINFSRTRAIRRAVQQRPRQDPVAVATELFGVWWLDAESLGFGISSHPSSAGICGAVPVAGRVDDPESSDLEEGGAVPSSRHRCPGLWTYKQLRAALRWAAR